MTRDTFGDVPNQPRTPARSVRIPDDVWEAAKELADERGAPVSEIVREALERYVRQQGK